MKCTVCKGDYEAKRSTSKYCSDKCRKLAFSDKEVSVPETVKSDAKKNGKKVAVLHPQPGTNQVLLTRSTRAYFSYWDDEVVVKPDDCRCEFCVKRGYEAPEVRK